MGSHPKAHLGDDARLMRRAAEGDETAFAELYKGYFPIVVSYLAYLSGKGDSPDDLTQEVFARVWQNKARFQGKSTVRTFILGVAKKVLLEQQRGLAKETEVIQRLSQEPAWILSDASSTPESKTNRTELVRLMKLLVDGLSIEQKEAVRLAYFEGMSLQEAARHANCGVEAFRSRLRRAYAQLRQFFEQLG